MRSAHPPGGWDAIAVITESDPQRLVVARMGVPLILGRGDGENFAASDTSALVQVTNFGSNPSGLQMYVYVPTTAKANPPTAPSGEGSWCTFET